MQSEHVRVLIVGSGPAGSNTAPFTGWVDEIALWDRALTPAEVSLQFRSAVGK